MEGSASRLGRNLRWLFGSELAARALGFAYTAIVARLLGVEGFGLLSLSLIYAEIFALAIGTSFHEVYVRETLQGRREPRGLLRRMIRIQTVFALAAIGLGVGIGALYSGPSRWLLPLAAGLGFFRAVARTFLAVSISLEDFRPRSTYGVLDRVTALAAALLLWLLAYGPTGVLAALAGGAAMTALYSWISARRHLSALAALVRGRAEPDSASLPAAAPPTLRELLREGIAFSALRWLGVLHNRIDSLLVERLAGPVALGIYSAAYRLMEIFKLVPNLAEQTLYPTMSRREAEGAEGEALLQRALHSLLLVTTPLVLAAWILGDAAIHLVFGPAYDDSTRPWTVLMIALLFVAANRPFLVAFRAAGRLRAANLLTVVSLALNVVLNALWIPRYGPLGAALATLVSEVAFFAMALFRVPSVARSTPRAALRLLPSVAAALVVALLLRPSGAWFAAIASGLVYLAMVWATALSAADRRDLLAVWKG